MSHKPLGRRRPRHATTPPMDRRTPHEVYVSGAKRRTMRAPIMVVFVVFAFLCSQVV